MFRTQDEEKRRKIFRMAVIASISVVCAVVAITLIIVLIPKKGLEGAPDRIECPGIKGKSDCLKYGCEYDPVQRGPTCIMAKDAFAYNTTEVKQTENGITAKLKSTIKNDFEILYGPVIPSVLFQVDYITENILRIKLLDAESNRYEVPVQKEFPLLQKRPKVDKNKLSYKVELSDANKMFNYKVMRGDGSVLWDTSIGGLVLNDKFLQIASYLPSEYIFGLGEHTRKKLKHDLNYVTWPMFSRDRAPERGEINLYGVHPFYTCLESDSRSHGVLLLNSNAMEVTLMPAPGISFRTIGGVLDLFYFVGDNPEHVIQLYTSLVGRPLIPPYWSLGFQLSRYGYDHLKNLTNAVERTRQASIPQDVQYLDIDHMEGNKDFTYDKVNFSGLLEYVKKTKKDYGLKWIIILDPAIAAVKGYDIYESGLKNNVFIKRPLSWNKDMFPEHLRDLNVTFGKVWPREPVAFPDFFLKETKEWWIKCFVDYHKQLPFDGIWIDMNEPSNFGTNGEDYEFCEMTNVPRNECWVLNCPSSPYENPPYNPLIKSGSPKLSSKTICMDSVQGTDKETYRHYDVHSLYAWSQSPPTLEAAEKSTGTRSIVISRSTYPSSGRYVGHWLGDNKSLWTDLHDSVIGMLEFNLFGIPYIGADVCGFDRDTTPELCARWMQLGAFYPFFRNHNGKGFKEQDPAVLGSYVTDISKKAVDRRYTLLPYLYTLFYRAHVDGNTVLKPLFHAFPFDKTTWNIDEQFMWGDCFLVSPILKEAEKTVNAYLPKGEWWDFQYENSTQEKQSQQYIVKDANDYTPIHVKGGCIIPTEDIKLRTPTKDELRNISIYIYPENNKASGELFIDDGISKGTLDEKSYDLYRYQLDNCNLVIYKQIEGTSYKGIEHKLKQVVVFKVQTATSVTVNAQGVTSYSVDKENNVLIIDVNLEMKSVKKISWGNKDNKCDML